MQKILLVLPLRAFQNDGAVYIDSQAHNGLSRWLENFDEVTLACLNVAAPEPSTLPLDFGDRVRFVPLPETYAPHKFIAALPSVRAILRAEIERADFLQFAIGGLWGDWPSVACVVAKQMRRPYAVWTDKVESQAHRALADQKSGVKKLYTMTNAAIMARYERALIKRSNAGLFHGGSCYAAYAQHCANPHLVHNIHLSPEDRATESDIRSRPASPIRIAYAGRASWEKGITDWIDAAKIARASGLNIEATWFGDGPLLSEARRATQELPWFDFRGPVPHNRLIAELKTFSVFAFCHKTEESPRCLIEALMCGLPLIGYSSDYPRDLTKYGGGILTDHTPAALAEALTAFTAKREELTSDALSAGSEFSDAAVFRHRSDIIKQLSGRHSAR